LPYNTCVRGQLSRVHQPAQTARYALVCKHSVIDAGARREPRIAWLGLTPEAGNRLLAMPVSYPAQGGWIARKHISVAIANNQGKGFDRMCDPTYAPPAPGGTVH
jgi:hypothetical protein